MSSWLSRRPTSTLIPAGASPGLSSTGWAKGHSESQKRSRVRRTRRSTGWSNAGVVKSVGGKVRLLDRSELERGWDPATDTRLTVWEVTQHLIARHQNEGEEAAAELLRQVGGGLAEAARELAYRLFAICERKGWAQEALAYNALVTAWPEITRLAAQAPDVSGAGEQETMEV